MCREMSTEELKERCKDATFCVVCLARRSHVKVDEHLCEDCQNDETVRPRRLPKMTLKNGKTYFVDNRLRELRNVDNPYDVIDFTELLTSRKDLLE